ncbi:MAG: PilZ domain-containing protein [Thermodesulfobacteriota bacterium]
MADTKDTDALMSKSTDDLMELRGKRKRVLVLRVTDETGENVYGYGRNISKTGMFIATMKPRKVGEEFGIAFELPRYRVKIACRCRVARVIGGKAGAHNQVGMGVIFSDISEEHQTKIDGWIKEGI